MPPCDGRWRSKPAPARRRPLGEVGEKVGEVIGTRIGGVPVPLGEEAAELEQVRAIGGERVAGQPTLELQVSKEVQDQRLVAL